MLHLVCCALLLVPMFRQSPAPAQDAPLQMMTYQLVLLKKGPTPPPASPADQKKMQDEHLAGLAELNRKQINMVYGPILADEDIRGIAVLDVANAEAAKARFANDPFVKAGVMTPEVYGWMGPKGWFHAPGSYDVSNPANLEPLVFGFLVRGADTSQDKAAADALQKGHLEYMDALHKQGKLVMAGPLVNAGDRRGIVVYRVKDVAAAKALAAEDPAVKAGRLTLEAYPWMTFRGILK
jgi:uncharacterized protein YciI